MKILLSFMIFILLFSGIFAYSSLYNEGLGEFNLPVSAYSIGLGSVNFIADPVLNPTLQKNEKDYYFAVGFQGVNYRETEADYVFDSYENNIGKKTTYDNSYFFGEPAYMSAYMSLNDFGLFLGYINYISMDYSYSKITRDDYYVITSQRDISNDGNINTYFLSSSYKYKNFIFGANFSIIQGDAQRAYNILYVDPSYVDSSTLYSEEYSGIKGGFGIAYNRKNEFNITLFYQLPAYINNQRSITIQEEDTIITADEIQYKLPSIFGGGIEIQKANELPVKLYGEMIYERWTELNGNYMTYNDIIKYHLGISHKINEEFTLLYGVLYEPYRKDNHIVDMGISAGLSYMINNVNFTTGIQYIQNTYNNDITYYTNREVKLSLDFGIYF